LVGRGRADQNGNFATKISPNSRISFFTRFWDQRWYRKRFNQEQTFGLGEDIDLGDFELGEASIVEFRAVTSTESQGGHASPVANAYVELVRVSDGKVLDHCRTASDGKAQLRGPDATPVKLRFHFFHYSYWILGVGFESVYSDVFSPQETEAFTLDAPNTNIGNYYITSPLKAEALAFVRLINETDPSDYGSSADRDALLLGATTAGRLAAMIEPEVDTATAQSLLEDSAALYSRIDGYFMQPGAITNPTVLAALNDALTSVINDISLLQESIENH
jgi:hypothetical protein